MRYYPVFLDLEGRHCLVIGEGELAERKATALKGTGALVHRCSHFDPQEARQAFLIVAVEEDRERARQIKEYADENGILLNVVDQAGHCSFIAPAIVERGDLLIAVSTSGKSPALASKIRRQLEERFGIEYATLVDILGEIRPQVRERFHSLEERKSLYQQLVELDLLETIRDGGRELARAQVQKAILDKQNADLSF